MYSRFAFVENTIGNLPKVPRVKFLGSDGLFCFTGIAEFGSYKNPFATITSLSELYLDSEDLRCWYKQKKVISLNYGSSTTRPVLESKGMSEKFQERGKNWQKKNVKKHKKGQNI